MARSSATTVADYLSELPEDRRTTLSQVRDVVRKHLPRGYNETMAWGMIAYGVPESKLPAPYNKQPLCYAALAAQKNYCALYLMGVYSTPELTKRFKDGFKAAGKKLDMGQSCVRFKTADDLPLDVIASTIAAIPPDKWIEFFLKSRDPATRSSRKKKR